MDDPDCHSFIAQTLSKLKANLQLGEMVKFSRFSEFFQAMTQFAMLSIQSRGYLRDLPYVLILISRFLEAVRFTSVPIFNYMDEDVFKNCIFSVNQTYFQTFIHQVDDFLHNDEFNPLHNIELILKHCDQLGTMFSYQYERVAELVVTSFDGFANQLVLLLKQADDGQLTEAGYSELKKMDGKECCFLSEENYLLSLLLD